MRLFDMLLRASVALVWLYQGLWSKLLGGSPSQGAVVESTPGWTRLPASSLLRAIGAIEVVLAVWVLTGYRRRFAAITQTGLLLAMNAGGLVWGRGHISDPGGMVVNNLAFLALVWCVAERRGKEDGGA